MLNVFLVKGSPWAGTFARDFIFFSLTILKSQVVKMFVVVTIVIIAFCGNKTEGTARISLLTIRELMSG